MGDFAVTPQKGKPLGVEHNPWWWNPNNVYVSFGPADFRKRLKDEMGAELDITWNPINSRWQIWMRSDRLQHPVCRGWKLLFIHNGPDGEYIPLDERVFARLFSCSVQQHGSAKKYFDQIANVMERDRERADAKHKQDTIDLAMPSFEYSQIKNIGKGNKFSTYHA